MNKLKKIWIVLTKRGIVSLILSIFYHLKYIFYKLVLSLKYFKKNIYNFKMYLNPYDKGLSRTLILFGNRELDHKMILEKVLRNNMEVLDIGSNIGYYVLIERNLIGPNGKIIAVEPIPSNVKFLKKNLRLNYDLNTEVIEGAISNKDSYQDIYTSNFFNLGTFHPIGSSKKFINKKTLKVKTTSLTNLCLQNGFPDLIRMDVEGHEVKIFEDLVLHKNKFKSLPMICFETHLTKYTKKNSMTKILKKLFRIGYHVKLASSSSKHGTKILEKKYGYRLFSDVIKTDEEERKIYKNIKSTDAVKLICQSGGLRTVLLSNKFS